MQFETELKNNIENLAKNALGKIERDNGIDLSIYFREHKNIGTLKSKDKSMEFVDNDLLMINLDDKKFLGISVSVTDFAFVNVRVMNYFDDDELLAYVKMDGNNLKIESESLNEGQLKLLISDTNKSILNPSKKVKNKLI